MIVKGFSFNQILLCEADEMSLTVITVINAGITDNKCVLVHPVVSLTGRCFLAVSDGPLYAAVGTEECSEVNETVFCSFG